ncbi:MAG: MFS transporter [Jatrophihabitantaceae bacterium]
MTVAQAVPVRRLPYRGLVSSYFVSEVGTAMSGVAIPWLVLVASGSAGRTGLVGFAEMAPYVLLQATSGPLADRIGWRRTCVGGNVIAAAGVCAIPVLHVLGGLSFGVLLALVAVAGTARGAADAATSPLVPGTAALAGMSNERAAGLYSGANRAALLIGLPAAGLLIGATSPATVVLLDGISFAVAALGFAVTVPSSVQPERPDGPMNLRSYRAELGEGLRFLRDDRLLLGLAAMVAFTNLLDQALSAVLLPVWVRVHLHDASGVGVVGGVLAVGLLAGVLIGAWLGERLPRRLTFAVGFLIAGAPPFLALAIFSTLPPVLVVVAVAGFFGGFQNPIIGAVLYERVPARLQARVLGAVRASAWVGIPLGALVGGALAEFAGLRAALIITGLVMFAVTVAPFAFPVWHQMERPGGARRSR